MFFPRISLAVFGFALVLGAGPAAAHQSGHEANAVVARVNGQEIRQSDVLDFARTLPPQYQSQLQQIYPMLVQRLVDLKLAGMAGQAAGLTDDAEVKRRVAAAQEQVIRDVYLQRQIEARITDEGLQARYVAYVEANPPKREQRARHILLKTEEDAGAMIVKLDEGADFEELARENSTGPSAAQGGDLGYFADGQMVPEFAAAASALQPGEYSKAPVQTQFGWHVIKVEDRRESAPPGFEEVEPQLREMATREAMEEVFKDLRGKANVEILDAGGGAGAQ
jgi:peptidyl-prolyl cis-trans isomerase C